MTLENSITYDEDGNICGGKSLFNYILEKILKIQGLKNFIKSSTLNSLSKVLTVYMDETIFKEYYTQIQEQLSQCLKNKKQLVPVLKVIIEFTKCGIEYCKVTNNETKKKNMTEFLQHAQKKVDAIENGPDFIKTLLSSSDIKETTYHSNPVTNHLITRIVDVKEPQPRPEIEDYINKEVKVEYGNKVRNIIVTDVYTKGDTKYALVKDIIDGKQHIKTFIVSKIKILN
jgi:hypothetical protein